jgi:hypothetical protein
LTVEHPDISIVELFALSVRPVVVPQFQGVLPAEAAVSLIKPFPRLIVLVPVLALFHPAAADSVTLLLLAEKSSVPVNAPEVID